jgi:hypothetical protein
MKGVMKTGVKAILLVSFFLVCAGGVVITHFWQTERDAEVRSQEIYGTIMAHFKACQVDNFRQVYEDASTDIQKRFTLVQYETKLKSEYENIGECSELQFGNLQVEGEQATVQIYFLNSEHRVTPALYNLVREKGIWRVENLEIFNPWPRDRRLAGMTA